MKMHDDDNDNDGGAMQRANGLRERFGLISRFDVRG